MSSQLRSAQVDHAFDFHDIALTAFAGLHALGLNPPRKFFLAPQMAQTGKGIPNTAVSILISDASTRSLTVRDRIDRRVFQKSGLAGSWFR